MESFERNPLVISPEFYRLLGQFHVAFSILNFQVDLAIGQFLILPPLETHMLTAGLMFGPKARLLADLIGRSAHPNKAKILGALNKLRGNSKREIIAHGHIWSDDNVFAFVERIASGEFKVRKHVFTLKEFGDHVLEFLTQVAALKTAIGTSNEAVHEFAHALDDLTDKSKPSSQKVGSNA